MFEPAPLSADDSPAAGRLLAARHRRERERFPLLPREYEAASRAENLVGDMLGFCDGISAVDRHGDMVGFLTSFESNPDPSSPMARYLPERSMTHLVHGHAVAPHVDPGSIYGAMFGELAARALERGVIDHVVHVPTGDPAVEAAWVACGFGRVNAVAVRNLSPTGRSAAPGVEIRAAGPAEIEIVDRLVDEESKFHVESPMFRPYRREETRDSVREELAAGLVDDDQVFLIARHNGRDIGVICVGPATGSPLYRPDGSVYIAATAVLDDTRGAGIGAALVDAAFGWARDRGHRSASLHFATANAVSTSFWTGIGFIPTMVHMRRLLDPRIIGSPPSSLTRRTPR